MNKTPVFLALFFTLFLSLSSQVSASLILETYTSGNATPSTIGGYAMTDFALLDSASTSTSSVASPLGGLLKFYDINGNVLSMNQSTVDDTSWWVNGESDNYDIYTTSVHYIKMLLPENTLAFSFNVGANLNASAWLTAEGMDGSIINKTTFPVSPQNSPGFGIYSDVNSCSSAITAINVDPHLIWGLGNFSISQGDCSTSVPEPNILALFGLGLISFALIRRRNT